MASMSGYPPMPPPPYVDRRRSRRVLVAILMAVAFCLNGCAAFVHHLTATTRHDGLTASIAADIDADEATCPPAAVVLTQDRGLFNPWYVAVRWDISNQAEAEVIASDCLQSRPKYRATDRSGNGPCAVSRAQCWDTDAGSFILKADDTLGGMSGAPHTFVGKEDNLAGNLRVRVVRILTPAGRTQPDHVELYAINL